MSRTVVALLCFLSVTESLIICTGNTFAFLVFRSQLFSMKRSYYLVLNLASAPLFVGVTHPISLIKKALPVLVSMKTPTFRDTYTGYLLSSLSFIFIYFNNLLGKKLSQLSFHFVTRTAIISKYLCRIAFIWLVATFITGFSFVLCFFFFCSSSF